MAAAQTPIDVFLIAGQSNATGVPDSAEGSPKTPPGDVLQYYKGRISDADDPVGAAQFGSAWPEFGDVYHAATGRRVLLVPASVPASSLSRKADFLSMGHWDEGGRLLDQAVAQTGEAMKAAGPTARFAGVLWDQGEADAVAIGNRFETAADYKRLLRDTIARFRAHLGAGAPFYIFETGATPNPDQSGYVAVRQVQVDVSATTPDAPIVFKDAVSFMARGMMSKAGPHYTQAGYNEMGRKGAQGVLIFQRTHPLAPGP